VDTAIQEFYGCKPQFHAGFWLADMDEMGTLSLRWQPIQPLRISVHPSWVDEMAGGHHPDGFV
jgi:hypothetical protein